jgi:acetyltransferase-like isoleucine patch superfamily enzyme
LGAFYKNIKQIYRISHAKWSLISKFDVLIEPNVAIKFPRSISFGKRCTVQSGTYIYGSRRNIPVKIGDYVVISHANTILGEGGLEIGDFTHLGPKVTVVTQYGDGQSDPCVVDPKVKYAAIAIGKGCWIGAGSIIMPGTRIGDRTRVAPNSVVYGRWPGNQLIAGDPARPCA